MLDGETQIFFSQWANVSEDAGYVVLEIVSMVDNGIVTVDYGTVPGSATSPSDFPQQSGQLTFQASPSPVLLTVQIANDCVLEDDETFEVVLSNPSSNAVIVEDTAVVQIVNDDEFESYSESTSIPEGAAVGTNLHTIELPSEDGPYTFTIVSGNADGYFAVDADGNVSVADLPLADGAEVHPLSIEVSCPCGIVGTVDLEVTVLPVLIDIYQDDADFDFSFQLDRIDTTPSSQTSYLAARPTVHCGGHAS